MEEKTRSGTWGLEVPGQPLIPRIEGDGIGGDIWKAAVRLCDAAVAKGIRSLNMALHGNPAGAENRVVVKEAIADIFLQQRQVSTSQSADRIIESMGS
jgi:isocitrate dehydrogenase